MTKSYFVWLEDRTQDSDLLTLQINENSSFFMDYFNMYLN